MKIKPMQIEKENARGNTELSFTNNGLVPKNMN